MANDFIYGVDGAVSIGSKVVSYVTGWTMNVNTGVADTPSLGSSGPKRTYTGYKDFTGSLNAQMVMDTAAASSAAQEQIVDMFVSGGTPIALAAKFVESSASAFTGNVVFSNITKSQSAEGLQAWSADWAQSAGPLVHATAS